VTTSTPYDLAADVPDCRTFGGCQRREGAVAGTVTVAHTVVVPPDEVALIGRMVGAAHQPVTATSLRLITRRGMQDPARRYWELLDSALPTAISRPQPRIIERHRLSVRRALTLHAIMPRCSEAALHLGGRQPVWRPDHKTALAEERGRAERRRLDETLAGRRFGVFEVATR